MSDRDVIAALQRQAAEAEVERLRLVAQRDDLLAALKEAAEMCVDGYVGGDPSTGPHLCWCFEHDLFVCRNTTRCQAARDAIAKATT